jgi:hypothetical protein
LKPQRGGGRGRCEDRHDRERHDEASSAGVPEVFGGDESDRETDQRFHGRRVRAEVAEHGERQRDAVRHREAGDDARDLGERSADEKERGDERQVIVPAQDVLDAERHVLGRGADRRFGGPRRWNHSRPPSLSTRSSGAPGRLERGVQVRWATSSNTRPGG